MRNSSVPVNKKKNGLTVMTFQKRKGSLYLKLGIVVAALFAVFTIINQESEISKIQQSLDNATLQLQEKQVINDEMEWIVENCNDYSSYERIARSELGFVKPYERVFVFVTGDEK